MFKENEKIPNHIVFDMIELRKYKDGQCAHHGTSKGGSEFVTFRGAEYTNCTWSFIAFDDMKERFEKLKLYPGCKVRITGNVKMDAELTEAGAYRLNVICRVESIYLRSRPSDEKTVSTVTSTTTTKVENVEKKEIKPEAADTSSSIPADMFLTMPTKHFG